MSSTSAPPLAKPAIPPFPSPLSENFSGGLIGSSVTLPPNFAFTGPIFKTTFASSSVSECLTNSSQPGMHSFKISGSLSPA